MKKYRLLTKDNLYEFRSLEEIYKYIKTESINKYEIIISEVIFSGVLTKETITERL